MKQPLVNYVCIYMYIMVLMWFKLVWKITARRFCRHNQRRPWRRVQQQPTPVVAAVVACCCRSCSSCCSLTLNRRSSSHYCPRLQWNQVESKRFFHDSPMDLKLKWMLPSGRVPCGCWWPSWIVAVPWKDWTLGCCLLPAVAVVVAVVVAAAAAVACWAVAGCCGNP